MKSFPELHPRWPDAVVAAAVAVLAVACAWLIWRGAGQGGALEAVVSVDGSEEFAVSLEGLGRTEHTVSANGYTLTLALFPDGAEMTHADCPTQDCVRTGRVTRPGQSIVCLPARVSVTLAGSAEDGVDAVLG